MKKRLTIVLMILVFSLMSGTAFAMGYCKDIAPTDPPDKTFDDQWTMNAGEAVAMDIYLNDIPEALTYVMVWIAYDTYPGGIYPRDLQIYDGVNGPPGPWDPALTILQPPCGGPLPCPTMVIIGNAEGAQPDEDGDIILCRIGIQGSFEGDSMIIVQVFPELDFVIGESGTVYDTQIAPNTIEIHLEQDLCEGNFDCDGDCDGTDAAAFKVDFGRSTFLNPCTDDNQCNGDFDCDVDVDGTDAALFKADFGRSLMNNPCPTCVVGEWCVY
jgi:hypothetical protein